MVGVNPDPPALGAAACTDMQVFGNEVRATLHPSAEGGGLSPGVSAGHFAHVLTSPA